MKIGFHYICTGPYIEFFEEFYTSAEKNFLTDCEKHYFVFTDGDLPLYKDNPRVTIIPQHQFEWPQAVLYKFHYLLQSQHLMQTMDYLIMTNANVVFNEKISKEEILPGEKENHLFGTEAPWLYKTGERDAGDEFFENNVNSTAYVEPKKRITYFAAIFCGGRREEFIKMCRQLRDWTEQDLANNIVPLWDDQAYLNRYLLERKVKILMPTYCYPEEYPIPFEKKIIVTYKQGRKNDPLKKKYRKYSWDKEVERPKNFFVRVRKYSIYHSIKFLKRYQ